MFERGVCFLSPYVVGLPRPHILVVKAVGRRGRPLLTYISFTCPQMDLSGCSRVIFHKCGYWCYRGEGPITGPPLVVYSYEVLLLIPLQTEWIESPMGVDGPSLGRGYSSLCHLRPQPLIWSASQLSLWGRGMGDVLVLIFAMVENLLHCLCQNLMSMFPPVISRGMILHKLTYQVILPPLKRSSVWFPQ